MQGVTFLFCLKTMGEYERKRKKTKNVVFTEKMYENIQKSGKNTENLYLFFDKSIDKLKK